MKFQYCDFKKCQNCSGLFGFTPHVLFRASQWTPPSDLKSAYFEASQTNILPDENFRNTHLKDTPSCNVQHAIDIWRWYFCRWLHNKHPTGRVEGLWGVLFGVSFTNLLHLLYVIFRDIKRRYIPLANDILHNDYVIDHSTHGLTFMRYWIIRKTNWNKKQPW